MTHLVNSRRGTRTKREEVRKDRIVKVALNLSQADCRVYIIVRIYAIKNSRKEKREFH